MTEGAYHAGIPASQPYWRTPRNSKTIASRPVTCFDAILTVLWVTFGLRGPIPCMQVGHQPTRWGDFA